MKNYTYLGIISVLYATFAIMSNVTAGKIVEFGPLVVSVTVLFFPFTYIFSDIVTEVYGYARARSLVWLMLGVYTIAAVMAQIAVWVPGATGFENSAAYEVVLGSQWRIIIASLIAVWAGALVNDYMLAKLKILTDGALLWVRTIGSTIAGEGVNTVLFYTIALYGILPDGMLVTAVLSGWLLKVVVEVVMTPVTYKVVAVLKKAESEDYYDRDTNFNPFIVGTVKM
jgi:queuosine precursor transporter